MQDAVPQMQSPAERRGFFRNLGSDASPIASARRSQSITQRHGDAPGAAGNRLTWMDLIRPGLFRVVSRYPFVSRQPGDGSRRTSPQTAETAASTAAFGTNPSGSFILAPPPT
jgi:hypothetical protein